MRLSTPSEQLHTRRWLLTIVLVALALRVAFGLAQNPLEPYQSLSADGSWYLRVGLELVQGADFSHLPPAPLYLLFGGFWQTFLPSDGAVIAIRLAQAAMSAATCWLAFLLARQVAGSARAGLIAAAALALSPAFIIEAAQVATETLYIFLVAAGMAAYIALIDREDDPRWWPALALVGLLFGLATLTRAVSLLFPLGLALHLLLVWGWRRGSQRALVLLLVYALVVSTWTIYNLARFNRLVIGAEGLAATLYIGATENSDPYEVDRRLAEDSSRPPDIDATYDERQEAYVDAAANVIGSNPLSYVARRFNQLAGAYLQPHGTIFFPGDSLKDLSTTWLRENRTLGGLLDITRGDAFWPKLAIYAFHYTALIGGLAGIWLLRRRRRVALPLAGFILYTTLVHLVLLALPRYIFPTQVFWWVFAAAALARLPFPRRASVTAGARQAHSNI